MKVTYQASDGYCGGSRPLHARIDDQDLKDCDSLDEAVEMAEDIIQEDFLSKVTPSYDDKDLRRDIAILRGESA